MDKGEAITVHLKKHTGDTFRTVHLLIDLWFHSNCKLQTDLTVTPETTLDLLKKDIKKLFVDEEKQIGSRKISWLLSVYLAMLTSLKETCVEELLPHVLKCEAA